MIFSAALDEGKLIVAFNPARAAAKKVDEMVNIIPPKNLPHENHLLQKTLHLYMKAFAPNAVLFVTSRIQYFHSYNMPS